MGYSLEYITEEKIVSLKIMGRLNFKIAEKYSKEASKLAHKNNCTKILIDHTETSLHNGIYKIHTSGDEMQQFGFNNFDKIAVVISAEAVDSSIKEPAGKNSHWSLIKYFYADKLQEAYDWLIGQESK